MSAVSPVSAAVPTATPAAATAQLNPQLLELVKQLPADQQAAALQQLAKMSPAQQTQLLQQVTAQAQAQTGAPTAGADQAALGAQATNAPQPNLLKTLAKNALIFGGVGAALGFGASFLPNPLMGITLPAAPVLAAIGGGIGAVVGLVKGFLSYKKQVAATASTAQNTAGPGVPAAAEPSAAGSLEPVKKPPTASPASASAPAPASSGGGTYTVKKGDTLGKIAKAHDMTWQELYKHNRAAVGSNPNMIHPGLKLKLP